MPSLIALCRMGAFGNRCRTEAYSLAQFPDSQLTAAMGYLKVFSFVVPVLAVLGTVGLSPGIK